VERDLRRASIVGMEQVGAERGGGPGLLFHPTKLFLLRSNFFPARPLSKWARAAQLGSASPVVYPLTECAQ